MEHRKPDPPEPTAPRHEGGDPATLKEDPAQAYPTGGAGLLDPENDRKRDTPVVDPPTTRGRS